MTELSDEQQLVVRKHALPVVIMGLEKRTVGSMGTLMTTEDALSSVSKVGKESSPGCAASSSGPNAEPKGFKRDNVARELKCLAGVVM